MYHVPLDPHARYKYIEEAKRRCNERIETALVAYVQEIYEKARQHSRGQDSGPLAIKTLLRLREAGQDGFAPTQTIRDEAGYPPDTNVVRHGLRAWVIAGVAEEEPRSISRPSAQTSYRIRDEFYPVVKNALG